MPQTYFQTRRLLYQVVMYFHTEVCQLNFQDQDFYILKNDQSAPAHSPLKKEGHIALQSESQSLC